MMRMSVHPLALLGFLCFSLTLTQAKIVSVSGDIEILSASQGNLPANVFSNDDSNNPNNDPDTSSPIVGGDLKIGAFDEQLSQSPSQMYTLANGAVLLPTVKYDSVFLFFHQKRPGSVQLSAVGSVTLDNRYIGCVSSDGVNTDGLLEFRLSPDFGLPQVRYPLITDPEYFNGGSGTNNRGYEANDIASGTGTTFGLSHIIQQPGDYNRCFSATCITEDNQACSCSASLSLKTCINTAQPTQTFASITALALSDAVDYAFSSTCLVDISSSEFALNPSSCTNPNDGCTVHGDGSFTIQTDQTVTLLVDITAGCDCTKTVPLVLTPCGGCPYSKVLAADATSDSISSPSNCACFT